MRRRLNMPRMEMVALRTTVSRKPYVFMIENRICQNCVHNGTLFLNDFYQHLSVQGFIL